MAFSCPPELGAEILLLKVLLILDMGVGEIKLELIWKYLFWN